MRNHGSSCRLLPQPGVGLGEHLADLGVVEELVDLFESSPLEPLAMGVCDVLLRAGGMDGLDDLTPPADVGVGQAALKAVQERPVDDARLFLELAGGRLTARLALFDTTFGEFPLGARITNGGRVEDQVQESALSLPAEWDDAGGSLVKGGHVGR